MKLEMPCARYFIFISILGCLSVFLNLAEHLSKDKIQFCTIATHSSAEIDDVFDAKRVQAEDLFSTTLQILNNFPTCSRSEEEGGWPGNVVEIERQNDTLPDLQSGIVSSTQLCTYVFSTVIEPFLLPK